MKKIKHISRAYVRRRAGRELYLHDKPLEVQMLIESIEKDFQLIISIDEAKQLFTKYLDEQPRATEP